MCLPFVIATLRIHPWPAVFFPRFTIIQPRKATEGRGMCLPFVIATLRSHPLPSVFFPRCTKCWPAERVWCWVAATRG